MKRIADRFNGIQRHPHWNRLAVGSAWVEESYGLKLILKSVPEGFLSTAQLDDFQTLPREYFPWQPPVTLRLRARASLPSGQLLGTAGFGFWNNMAPLSSTHMEVFPNWMWFYYASPQTTISPVHGPANGWKASVVHGGLGGERAMAWNDTLLRIPLIGKKLGRVQMPAREKSLENWDFSVWHDFEIYWHREAVHFRIDGDEVLEAHLRVEMPLAFIAWMDNNYAGIQPDGNVELGYLAVPEEQMLIIDNLEITTEARG
jgi:hypothetical protein